MYHFPDCSGISQFIKVTGRGSRLGDFLKGNDVIPLTVHDIQ